MTLQTKMKQGEDEDEGFMTDSKNDDIGMAFSIPKEVIKELADIMEDKGLSEIELKDGDRKLKMSRGGSSSEADMLPIMRTSAAPFGDDMLPVAEADMEGDAVTSPMVGTAYLRPEPDGVPFVTVGQNVAEGQTLMIIEAMKVMNLIRADKAGSVKKILVEDGQPVEFGEALLIIS